MSLREPRLEEGNKECKGYKSRSLTEPKLKEGMKKECRGHK